MSKAFINCCSCICRCLLIVTNVAAIIIGIALLLLGVMFTFGFSMLSSVLEPSIKTATSGITMALKTGMNIDMDVYALLKNISSVTGGLGAALMVIGIIVLLLACFGCCGASCKAQSCLILYGFIVAVVFLAQVIVVIVWFSDSSVFKNSVKSSMEASLKDFTGIGSSNIQSLLQNLLQVFVGCCGVNNGTDFAIMSPRWNKVYTMSTDGYNSTFNLTYPVTCCKFNLTSFLPEDSYCPYNNTNSNYRRGCYAELFSYIESYMRLSTMFYALGGILGFEALLIAGAIIIHRASDESNKVRPQ